MTIKMPKREVGYYKRLKYRIETFFGDEDQCWFARLPDLWDTMADGKSPEEAIRKVLKLKDQVIDIVHKTGRQIPEPRQEIEYSGRFLLRVPKSLHQKLAQEAEREGTSINRLVIQVLSEEMTRRATWGTFSYGNMKLTTTIRPTMTRVIVGSSVLPHGGGSSYVWHSSDEFTPRYTAGNEEELSVPSFYANPPEVPLEVQE